MFLYLQFSLIDFDYDGKKAQHAKCLFNAKNKIN